MEGVATVLWGLGRVTVQVGRTAALPTAFCWGVARFVLGVSLSYALQCTYLELLLNVRRSLRGEEPAPGGPTELTREQREAPLRGVRAPSEAEYTSGGQTLPPSRKVSSLRAEPPANEEVPYGSGPPSRWPSWSLGRAPRERPEVVEDEAWHHRVRCLREGAEVHRQVRQYVQQRVRPGTELREIAEMVEGSANALLGYDPKDPLRRGWAFPVGLSLNEVAAHDSPNPGDPGRWLLPTDLVKLDFGVHVEGHILDCAFSFTFDAMHDELMQAVKDATNEGIRLSGPDALVREIGGCIREVMEAAEVHRPDGKVLPVYSIKNLTGHSIAPYKIHAGKPMPSCDTGGSARMLAGELWAIETFGSAGGMGYVCHAGACSHYMRPDGAAPSGIQRAALSDHGKALLELVDRRFGTLAFCPRWVAQEAGAAPKARNLQGQGDARPWWAAPLEELCNLGVVNRYPPLADLHGSYTAQYEHTILLRESGKEVLTRGSDY